MLARRELSEAQVRERLARRGHASDQIDDAIARLRDQGAIDDARAAQAIARAEAGRRRRGRVRVARQIARAGIAGAAARRAVDEVYEDVDEDELLKASLRSRLRDREPPGVDDREFRRLYRYLTGQGFDSDKVIRALKALKGR